MTKAIVRARAYGVIHEGVGPSMQAQQRMEQAGMNRGLTFASSRAGCSCIRWASSDRIDGV